MPGREVGVLGQQPRQRVRLGVVEGVGGFPGQTVPVVDPATSEISQAEIFVAVLGASDYTYVEAVPSQELPHWIAAHVHAFAYFGGCPAILVPDNLRSGVTRANRYEPDLNRTYAEMAAHYGSCRRRSRPTRTTTCGALATTDEEEQMLTNPTLDKLRALNLTGMARALAEQLERPEYHALSFEERLGLLVDREAQDRDNRRLERHLKAAKLRSDACVEDIDFRHPRGLDRGQLLGLAAAHWVAAHQNVLVVGPTGSGKTFVACALAQATIRRGHTALYLRAPRLLGDLALARADGRLPRLLASWARVDVLVVDDFALRPLLPEQTADLLEVIEC